MNYQFYFVFICAALMFSSCKKEDTLSQAEIDAQNKTEILQYIADNNLNADSTASGLYYVIQEQGIGSRPTISDRVTVHYHGYFTDGQVFDSSIDRGERSTFGLNQVIRGWQEGIPLFSRGGEGILLIPSRLAYGTAGRGSIPPNSVLIFNIELFDF